MDVNNFWIPITVKYGKTFFISLEYEKGNVILYGGTTEPVEKQIHSRFIIAMDYYRYMMATRNYITPYDASILGELYSSFNFSILDNIKSKTSCEDSINELEFKTLISKVILTKPSNKNI